eukprot:m.112556 g.112556  ORF g.112556 m.112556 type:complete len:53 (-) comp13482_c0_seq1:283-441(-)
MQSLTYQLFNESAERGSPPSNLASCDCQVMPTVPGNLNCLHSLDLLLKSSCS